ncbi:MAG: hypothetical protein HOV79_24100 [Hamadaea sp.]|nr:hypothetical protein [Hamadaea sp.]
MAIVVPDLDVPVELRASPHAAQAERAARAVLREHALARGPQADDYVERTRFGALVACMYPDAYEPELCLVARWMALWSIVDDQLERLGAVERPQTVASVCAAIASWVDGRAPGREPAIAVAFRSVWAGIAATASESWRRRLRHEFRRHLDGCRWEAEQVRARKAPAIADYLRWRPLFFGAHVALALGEYARRAELPPSLIGDPVLRKAVGTGIELMIISNDLLSADIEAEQGGVNLVAILGERDGCTPQQSADRLAGAYGRRLAAYREQMGALRRHCAGLGLGERERDAVLEYARGPLIWTRGQIAWSTGNPRYSADRAAFYRVIPDHIGDLARTLRHPAARPACGQ